VALRRNATIARQLSTLFHVGTIGELTDGQLLERFVTGRGEPAELAFAALVERHGPLVLHTCRSIVRDELDAEDAFQATFLVLVRKAGTLWTRDSLGPWLHQVAYRAARHARSDSIRRKIVEQTAAEMASVRAVAEPACDDLNAVVHEEVARLPDRYRVPVLLCDLEGRTYEQVARHLGCPVGTVKSRLARARERLRNRLARRGLDMPAGLFAAVRLDRSGWGAVPSWWVDSTTRAAVRVASARPIAELVRAPVLTLVNRTSWSSVMSKWKYVGLTHLTLWPLAGVGIGVLARHWLFAAGDVQAAAQAGAAQPAASQKKGKPPNIRGNWVVVYIAGTVAGKRQGYVMPNLMVPVTDQTMNLPFLTGKPNDPMNYRGPKRYFLDKAFQAETPVKSKVSGGLTTSFYSPKAQPGAIDLLPAQGTNDGFDLLGNLFSDLLPAQETNAELKVLRGIYRLQGNILSICYDKSETGRPQTFDDDKESENIIILQRETSASIPESKPSPAKLPTTTTHPPTGPAPPTER
jgi:RNA polymerase sigma-70 factor (ECF subfamily)